MHSLQPSTQMVGAPHALLHSQVIRLWHCPALCLAVAEALIAPAMPSTTARAGGIFMPIINSLSLNAGSKPSESSRLRYIFWYCFWYCCPVVLAVSHHQLPQLVRRQQAQ